MRIAIVTVYDSIVNYGSFLQAYALQEVLKSEGHEVAFVKRMNEDELLDRFNRIEYRNSGVAYTKKWDVLRKLNRYRRYLEACRLNKRRLEFFSYDFAKLNIIDSSEAESYECIICGSDEIWNKNNKDIDIDFYTCANNKNKMKYAYAISCGNMAFESLSNEEISNIQKFKRCLCRDENTLSVLERCEVSTSKQIVCDPTILFGKTGFQERVHPNNVLNLPERYLLVYSYVYSKKEKEAIRKYAKANNLAIVSAVLQADFADQVILSSAFDFPYIIECAECFYTSTFHGTIFGMMFAKKLAISPRMHKIKSVVEACDVCELTIHEDFSVDELVAAFAKNVEHEKIESNMSRMRTQSHKQLLDMLESVNNIIN